MKDYTEEYILTKISLEDGKPIGKTVVQFEAVQLDDVLMHVENFIRGAGFYPQGELVFWDGKEDAIL